ncbi:anaphase-promoting complex subunit cdc27 [Vermiconidia calcicola]|uniref:Anaphase-promoting complex subunit cdc27 n=1 Tax=Vermiconidia calcicola TaxID=1690605 RepID=A0ACC3NIK5_9PEZI|nr:anaphase-promoting complex subunit cdc27 [Vermiconidia calcicola]
MTTTHTPATPHLLTQQIHQHLDADLADTANFLAGRLHALEPRSPESAHLLALTYLRLRRFKAAADTAQKHGSNGRHLGCAYVFAQSCLQLGRGTEGIAALEKSKSLWGSRSPNNADTARRRFIPDAPSCWTVLGKLWQAHGDMRKAGDCFVEAHKSNPFVWEAFEGLCKVGADLNVGQVFKPTADMVGAGTTASTLVNAQTEIYTDEQPTGQAVLAPQNNFNHQVFTPSADPFATSKSGGEVPNFGLPNLKGKLASKAPLSEWDTPTMNGGTVLDEAEDVAMSGVLPDTEVTAFHPPAAPARRTRPGQQFETSDRPRPPALRGHATSASEGYDESAQAAQQRRKPSGISIGGHKRTISGQQPQPNTAPTSVDLGPGGQQPIRRSNRLFGQSTTSSKPSTTSTRPPSVEAAGRPAKTATGTKGRIGSTVGRVVSGNRKVLPPDRNSHKDEKQRQDRRALSRTSEREKHANDIASTTAVIDSKMAPPQTQRSQQPALQQPDTSAADYAALTTALDSLRTLAQGVYATTRFDTTLAIRIFRSLPSSQRETPFVLAQLGKAHYEAGDYKTAEEAFARVLKLQPSRTHDMEVYSTVLWHLKKDAALAFLCHALRSNDSNAPETWVAVGNAFSLSREHDQAISAFKRAVQVSSEKFAYAWTLMGHEYIANEDFDSALSSFRHAVSVDRRGYGGWYGLGKCHDRMGKLEDAERYYRIAASINPANSTLLVCIGVILERLRNRKGALANYTRALELAPTSALARFKKARVLMHLRHYDEALVELEVLREQAPEEANVWFLLGKCYKGLGERGEGLRCFTCALNLDVKAAPLIKEAMEALDEEDEEGEEGSEDE